MDVALEKRQVAACVRVLGAGRTTSSSTGSSRPAARPPIKHLDLSRQHSVLEVGIGTGLNLPLYPATCRLTGIDLSQEMLDKAVERVQTLTMPERHAQGDGRDLDGLRRQRVRPGARDLHDLRRARPVAVLREMRRVVKPDGIIVILNHFRSELRVTGGLEDLVAPVCTRLGWKSNLAMKPLLEQVGLDARGDREGEHVQRVAPREVRQPEVAPARSPPLSRFVLVLPVARGRPRACALAARVPRRVPLGRPSPDPLRR